MIYERGDPDVGRRAGDQPDIAPDLSKPAEFLHDQQVHREGSR